MANKKWIVENGVPIVLSYGGNITIRALHYQLVAIGMPNDMKHYKKVVNAMIYARWENLLSFDAFLDYDRSTIGRTRYEQTCVEDSVSVAKVQIRAWGTNYQKNRWENQPIYPEIFIEKKALQGVFESVCNKWDIALNPCKGYPSLTFLHDAMKRYSIAHSRGKELVMLYFGDYDCTGEDIPRSIAANLSNMGVYVDIKRVMLMEDQVLEWKLPPAPTKMTDSRAEKWGGIGQVELDAVTPQKIQGLCDKALSNIFDDELYDVLLDEEEYERVQFKKTIRENFKKYLD